MILAGDVAVNGEIVRELGTRVSDGDEVRVRGKVIRFTEKNIYILLNKPIGFVTTCDDEKGRDTVIDLVRDEIEERVYPVGRLDMMSSGAIILTNDGEVANRLMHPKFHMDKRYEVMVGGEVTDAVVRKLEDGMEIEGRRTAPAKVEIKRQFPEKTFLEVTIHEGRNRQIRKMFEAVGHRVLELKRVAIGNILLGNLPEGRFRHLNKGEIGYLMGRK